MKGYRRGYVAIGLILITISFVFVFSYVGFIVNKEYANVSNGGWNRIVLQVQDLPARITELKKEGVHFRNEMEVGPAADRSKWKTQMAT